MTYALALVLLIGVSYSLWMTLVFPTWVFAVSVCILVLSLRDHDAGSMNGVATG